MRLKDIIRLDRLASRGLKRISKGLPREAKLTFDIGVNPVKTERTLEKGKRVSKMVYRPQFRANLALSGAHSNNLLAKIQEEPWLIPIMGASAAGAGLATGEIISYLNARAKRNKNFDLIISNDEYLRENRGDAKIFYNQLYNMAPRAMSNLYLARQVLRQTVSMGTISPEIVRQLQSIEAQEHPLHRALGHISGMKMPFGG